MTTRFRPAEGRSDFAGKTREEWVQLWSELPTWNRHWAERRFDEMVAAGILVEAINNAGT